jgi:hypothetical protein
MARELGPKNIHVAHLVIDAGVDTGIRAARRIRKPRRRTSAREPAAGPADAAAGDSPTRTGRSTSSRATPWSFEMEIRPFGERW